MIKNAIVLVPFPFDDSPEFKLRPALCLTSEVGDFKHIVIAFISSKIPTTVLNSDIVLQQKQAREIGLAIPSVIKIHKIVSIPKKLIKRKLGMLTGDLELEVKEKLMALFEL